MKQKVIKKRRQFKTVDWQELERGDLIKIIGGHGPYMIINGQKHNIGVKSGKYEVLRLDENGIHAMQGISHCYIYMGKKKKSNVGMSAPHKFKKCLT